MAKPKFKLSCSFCKSKVQDVALLISAPHAAICSACASLTLQVICDKLVTSKPVRLVAIEVTTIIEQDQLDAYIPKGEMERVKLTK